jgi:hypothetical protein
MGYSDNENRIGLDREEEGVWKFIDMDPAKRISIEREGSRSISDSTN